MSDAPTKFYLTTPIYYVNARPHIGHAYTTIVADVLARRHRLLGDDVFLLTGTDEHGQKIERSAAAANIPPQQFADQVSASFEALWRRMGITNDDYIRTTSPRHAAGVQKLWRELADRGHIYLSSYTGAYCVSDEAFVDLPVGTPCPDCGRLLEQITEENYFFRLSAFQPHLIDLIESGTLAIEPETRRNEVLSFLRGNVIAVIDEFSDKRPKTDTTYPRIVPKEELEQALAAAVDSGRLRRSSSNEPFVVGALKDLSISRTGFKWGIPVPGNPKHVIYVWLDALANYMTAIGYGSDQPEDLAKFQKYWPADLHLVGKEIIRFHCVYWPAFLLAAGLPLPKKVQAHGWLLFEESKMSKSRGNIVRTETILDAFGTLCPPTFVGLEENGEAVGGSSGLQPTEKQPLEKGALAPGFREPAKSERDLFAADVLRYFLLREIPFGNDGSFSFDALITRYNADLANGYGNLVSRTLSMIAKRDGIVPEDKIAALDPNFASNDVLPYSTIRETVKDAAFNFDQLSFAAALTNVWSLITLVDGYMTQYAPWKLIASPDPLDQYKAGFILYSAAESIRIITALLYPVLPFSTAKVWAQLGLGNIEQAAQNGDLKNLQWGGLKPGTKLGPLAPIFPRADKGLAQIMTDMEQPNAQPNAQQNATPAAQPATELPPAPPTPTPGPLALDPGPSITIDDFAKIDLRAAVILVAERIPKADKLLRLEVDLGPLGRRQILSGIAEHYTPEELIGRRIVVIANLAPRKMRGLESHGMLLAASEGPENGEKSGKPILATFAEDIAPGSRLK